VSDIVSISTHVLDTAFGAPAAGVAVSLERMETGDRTIAISRGVTDADGRVPALAPVDGSVTPGAYRLCFQVADYFAATQRTSFYNEICVNFIVGTEAQLLYLPRQLMHAVPRRSPGNEP